MIINQNAFLYLYKVDGIDELNEIQGSPQEEEVPIVYSSNNEEFTEADNTSFNPILQNLIDSFKLVC
jgi:hypothetical protein